MNPIITFDYIVEYAVDISSFASHPGMVCAKSCEGVTCLKHREVCTPQPEAGPICICPGKAFTMCTSPFLK